MNIIRKTRLWLIVLITLVAVCPAQEQINPHIEKSNIVETILSDKSSFFYLDTRNYPTQNEKLPIGIFDSGTGGLTILEAIVNLDQHNNKTHCLKKNGDGLKDFQKEYFIYLGDQANMPYGNYAALNKTALLKEHIIKDVQFLLGNKYYLNADANTYKTDKEPVKTIVIACNTATAYGKTDIEKFIQKAGLNINVIGVIDAAVKAALSSFDSDQNGTIAVMATAGTVASEGYVKTFNTQKVAMNYTGQIKIFQQAGLGLAGAIDGSAEYIATDAVIPRAEYKGPSENNADAKIELSILQRYGFDWSKNKMLFDGTAEKPENLQINSIENYIDYHLVSLMEKIRKTADPKKLKAIIFGCTHYPFYSEVFRSKIEKLYNYRENGEYLYQPFMAKEIELIDPAFNTAKQLYEHLVNCHLLGDENLYKSQFYLSVPNKSNEHIQVDSSGNFTYEYKYGRSAGLAQQYVRRVPFSKKCISPDVLRRLSEKVPSTFELISKFNRNNPKTSALKKDERI